MYSEYNGTSIFSRGKGLANMFAIIRFRYIEVLLHILYWFLPHKCIVLSKSADLVADFGGNEQITLHL